MSLDISKKIILNTNNTRPNDRIIIKKGCVGTVTLIVTINDKGGVLELPVGTTAKVRMLKPDKKEVLNDCTISGNEAYVIVTEQMLASIGEGQCEVILLNGIKTLTTATFPITIEGNVHNDSQLESLPEYTTLLNSIIRSETAYTGAEGIVTLVEGKLANGDFNGPQGIQGIQGIPGSNATVSIIQTDTVNDSTKVPSSAVTYALGAQIDAINDDLVNRTNKTYTGTITGDYKNTVAENWSIMPHGVSIALLAQGSIAYVVIGKTSDLYGSVQITGYILNAPVYGTLNGGVWVWS